MSPIYDILKLKEKQFHWSAKAEHAFVKIKKEIVSHVVLIHYDQSLPLILTCDASSVGIGAVLSHKLPDGSERPIEFASRILSKAERNYGVIEREALSIVYGTKKFFNYLIGREFELVTEFLCGYT